MARSFVLRGADPQVSTPEEFHRELIARSRGVSRDTALRRADAALNRTYGAVLSVFPQRRQLTVTDWRREVQTLRAASTTVREQPVTRRRRNG